MAQRAILKSDRYGDRDEFVRFRDHVSDRQDESKLLRQPDPLGVLDVPSFGGIGGPQ